MAWELWQDNTDEFNSLVGFYCSSGGGSFGPIIYTNSGFSKINFYDLWDRASLKDPRLMTETELCSTVSHLEKFIGWKENINATINVFIQESETPFYTETVKTCYDNIDFSPFNPTLESLSEEEFDIVNFLIEDCNASMKETILVENGDSKISHKDKTVKIVMSWEIDEE